MNQKAVAPIARLVGHVTNVFLTALIVMLMLGTLLGNQGLYTPSYWESFGAVYLLMVLTNFVGRHLFYTGLGLINTETKLKNPDTKRKPLI